MEGNFAFSGCEKLKFFLARRGSASRPARPRRLKAGAASPNNRGYRRNISWGKTFFRIFQGKTAFGAFEPVSVSAARRRLEAGAAEPEPRGAGLKPWIPPAPRRDNEIDRGKLSYFFKAIEINGVRSVRTHQRKRCAAAPRGRRGRGAGLKN